MEEAKDMNYRSDFNITWRWMHERCSCSLEDVARYSRSEFSNTYRGRFTVNTSEADCNVYWANKLITGKLVHQDKNWTRFYTELDISIWAAVRSDIMINSLRDLLSESSVILFTLRLIVVIKYQVTTVLLKKNKKTINYRPIGYHINLLLVKCVLLTLWCIRQDPDVTMSWSLSWHFLNSVITATQMMCLMTSKMCRQFSQTCNYTWTITVSWYLKAQ